MSMMKEFKEFAMKGNVIDLAVGVIIGAAFGKIVTSIVEDIVMPVIGAVLGNVDFSNMYYFLGDQAKLLDATTKSGLAILPLAEAKKIGPVLAYGNFLTIALNFLIVAFAIFLVVKAINKAKSRFERDKTIEEEVELEVGPKTEDLLIEIRDLLRKKA